MMTFVPQTVIFTQKHDSCLFRVYNVSITCLFINFESIFGRVYFVSIKYSGRVYNMSITCLFL